MKEFKEGSIFVTVYNQRIKNVVSRINSVYNDTILNWINTNAGPATSWGLKVSSTMNITKWWQFYIGGNLYHYKINGSLFNNDVHVNTASWVYSLNANIALKFSPTFHLQGSVNYLSKRGTARAEDSRFICMIDFGS